MKKKRQGNEAFSIAFLDVITCGFGAIILLLMIAKTGNAPVLDASIHSLGGIVRELQTQLFEIRGESRILNRELDARQEQISIWTEKVAKLQSNLDHTKRKHDSIQQETTVTSIISGEFEQALQSLTMEMKRLAMQSEETKNSLIGGIPVDSEYIIFIIDTSGSMVNLHWNKMINQLIATLDVYPKVKGIQIMSDMGNYLFSQYRGKWIPDTEGRRKVIVNTLRGWNTFSNSSPVEGITQAVRTFYDPNKKISIYVFGDEFTGRSVTQVVETIARLNPKDSNGDTKIRIHAVGFPIPGNMPGHLQLTRKRFAMLMRELTYQNGGTFVGLN